MTSIQQVYNTISKDFDKSRFSVWSGVKLFLDSLPSNSMNVEIGCGNGKNMLYRSDLFFKGYDISQEFIKICKSKGLDAEFGDILNLDINNSTYDNTISIAVIHHIPMKEQRIHAIKELIRITKKGGKILIYVWAYEQPDDSKKKFNHGDNLVPFKYTNRYYYIYRKGELEEEIKQTQENIDYKIYWELGNWCCIINKI